MKEPEQVDINSIEINPEFVNKDLLKFRDDLEEALSNVGKQEGYKTSMDGGDYVNPYLPIDLARYAYHHSSTLRSVIESFSQDVFLNDYSLENPDEDPSIINKSWNKSRNKYQIYLAGIEYYLYGYGVLEIIDNAITFKLVQLPAHTIRLRVIPFNHPLTHRTYYFYYAEQKVNGYTKLFQISNYDYSMLHDFGVDHGATGTVLWLGGCNENEFFDIPRWIAKRKALFTDIAIDDFNSKKIEKGNILAGFLLLTGPTERKDPRSPDEPGIADKIEQDLKGGNCGTIVSYLGNTSSNRDIKMDYVVLQDNNWEYFEKLQDRCVDDLLRCFKMPKIRLAIDDIKESMNSNKSDTLYEIYNREVWASQMNMQTRLDEYNHVYLNVQSDMVISTPEFTDKTNTRITNTVTLFNNGLLSLGQALETLTPLFPNIDFKEEGTLSEDLYKTRFYNGNILGNNSEAYTQMDEIDNILDDLNQQLTNKGYDPLHIQ